jgi:outer membrane receptor protein involved in Fe transport
MKYNAKVSAAVAAIHGVPAGAWAQSADTGAGQLAEVTVTAERRTENLQDVPITIQALTSETLKELSVTTFDDFVKYLPNVTTAGYGPGQDLIFMRGLSTGALGTQGSGTDANFPNVAVYLDDQSAQMPYRNLDIYAVDLERVEVLEGPQGTLFGAGAQAGVVRYITNKPNLDKVEGNVNAGFGYTSHGDPNSNVDATLNLPLIPGTLAVRGVIYDDNRGGYINDVPGTFTRQNSDLGIRYAGGTVPTNPASINQISNASQVANAINPVTYQGLRLSGLWKINDDWNALITQSFQEMNAQGVFYQEPFSTDGVKLPDLSVTTFNPSYDKDKFENTAWTLNGQIGVLKAVYTGGYLVRKVDAQQDYTAYTRGVYADYYQCYKGAKAANGTYPNAYCDTPSAYWHNTQTNTHQSHEIRLSTPDDWRARAIVGGFWEDFKVEDNTDWFYKSLPACTVNGQTGCITDINPEPGSTIIQPGLRPDNESYFDDITRGYRQFAFYTSADFDIIPKTLILTAGTRYYDFRNTERGSAVSSFDCLNYGAPPCLPEDGHNENALGLNSTYAGFKSRANLTWHIDQDIMVYYTWSQGFRPGGFNRVANGPYLGGSYVTPQGFAPDTLTNNEIGWKTEWLDHRLLVNGAIYRENWNNVQLQFFDPGATGNLSFVANGANYRVNGVELQLVARVVPGLTVQGSGSWNSSAQTNSPYLIGNVPGNANFGKPLLSAANPYGPEGSPLANSPPFDVNLRVRYETNINDYLGFVQIGGTRIGHSYNTTGNVPAIASGEVTTQRFDQPAYSTWDMSVGVSKDAWNVQVVGQNLSDTRGPTFISAAEAIETQTVLRPRTVGMKLGYKF